MKLLKKTLWIFGATLTFFPSLSHAFLDQLKGKVDIGPAYVHIDTLQSGRTIGRRDLAALKIDSTVVFYKGFCLKPAFLWAPDSSDLVSAGISLGHCTPLGSLHPRLSNVTLIPSVGVTFTKLKTTITPLGIPLELEQCFYSRAPYLGLELVWSFAKAWRVCGLVQFAWSVNETTIEQILETPDKAESKGSNYAIMVEHDLNNCWSINAGGAYNLSMSHEKHGIRGYGAKMGISRWF